MTNTYAPIQRKLCVLHVSFSWNFMAQETGLSCSTVGHYRRQHQLSYEETFDYYCAKYSDRLLNQSKEK